MRIHAALQPSVSNTTTARRMAGSRFSVSNDNTAWKSAAAQAAAGINGTDVLLALHGGGGRDRAPPPFR
jgi:hypothetical protein